MDTKVWWGRLFGKETYMFLTFFVISLYCQDVVDWNSPSWKTHVLLSWSALLWLMIGSRAQTAGFMGSTWGPPGVCRPQVGPMLAPWTLLSGNIITYHIGRWCLHLPLSAALYWKHKCLFAFCLAHPPWNDTRVVQILLHERQGLISIIILIPWLLKCWSYNDGHKLPWYWLCPVYAE